jgi:hypothetical protein
MSNMICFSRAKTKSGIPYGGIFPLSLVVSLTAMAHSLFGSTREEVWEFIHGSLMGDYT